MEIHDLLNSVWIVLPFAKFGWFNNKFTKCSRRTIEATIHETGTHIR